MVNTSIPDLIKNSKIALNLDVSDEKDALLKLIKLLELGETKENLLYNSVLQREEMGSTGIGNGIAIPHTRSFVVTDMMIAIGRLKKPINFNSVDGKPVSLIFLIVAPPYAYHSDYLIFLGKIAEIFQESSINDKLFKIEGDENFKEELCKLFF